MLAILAMAAAPAMVVVRQADVKRDEARAQKAVSSHATLPLPLPQGERHDRINFNLRGR